MCLVLRPRRFLRCFPFLCLLFAAATAQAQLVEGVVPNHGQWPEEVVLQTAIDGGALWVTRTGMVYDFVEDAPAEERGPGQLGPADGDRQREAERAPLRRHRVRVAFEGGTSAGGAVRGEAESLTRVNYYVGNNPSRHAEGVPVYGAAVVPEVYPGVALRVEASAGGTAIRFEGARPALAAVRLRTEGAAPGASTVETAFGPRSLPAVGAWDGERLVVLAGSGEGEHSEARVPFAVSSLGSTTYAQYLGGSRNDEAQSVASDGSGGGRRCG